MVWNGASHGHSHDPASTNVLATGIFSGFKLASDYWVPEQENAEVKYENIKYTTKGMSGQVTVRVSFHNKEDKHLKTISFYLDIRYRGLIELVADENIELVGDKPIHPKNHFGNAFLIASIKRVAKAYGEAHDRDEFHIDNIKLKHRKLFVNDMSLQYGGRYDCKHAEEGTVAAKPFEPPHAEHMFGEEVDIAFSGMNSKQKDWFDKNAKKHGFILCEKHPKKGLPNHFHCSVVSES